MDATSDEKQATLWVKFHIGKVLLGLALYLLYGLLNWFLDPYFKYKNRKQIKDYESFFNGKIESKAELG